MKSQYRMLFAMIALLLVTSLGCYGGTPPTATSVPTNTPAPTKVPQVQPPAATPGMPQPPSGNQLNDPPPPNGGSPEMYTFTDQNDLLSFDLPGDWAKFFHNSFLICIALNNAYTGCGGFLLTVSMISQNLFQ